MQPGLHGHIPRQIEHLVTDRMGHQADAEERLQKAAHEFGPVVEHVLRHLVKRRLRNAVGIIVGLQQERHDRGDQRRAHHAFAAVSRHITRDFAAAHREADERDIVGSPGRLHHIGKVIGKRVVIIALPRLVRPAKSAPVIGDHAVPRMGERIGNRIPTVG